MKYSSTKSAELIGTVTIFTSTKPANLGKTFSLRAGTLEKVTAGAMTEGRFELATFTDAPQFAELLTSIRTDQALCHSLPRTDDQEGTIVTKEVAAKSPRPCQLARTKADFQFKTQPGVMILDYDPVDPLNALAREQLWEQLTTLSPAVTSAQVVWWCSGSSHIHGPGGEIQGLRGQRFYLLVQDASDIERAGQNLADRCWLAGLGQIKVGNAGQCLPRTLFDEAMHEPARLDFIGGAVCKPPVTQQRGQPIAMGGSDWLDTTTAFPSLDASDAAQVKRLIAAAKKAAAPAAAAARAAWLEAKIDDVAPRLQAEKNISPSEARQQTRQTYENALAGC